MTPFNSEGIGLHIRAADSILLISFDKQATPICIRIPSGYEDIEACLGKVAECLQKKEAINLPVFLCISGDPTQYFLSRVPQLNANMMVKAFRLQMKQQLGEEPASLQSVILWNHKTEEGEQYEYLVAATKKAFRDQVHQLFRKFALKMGGWDIDLLAYNRASNFLWRRAQADETSRFIIILGKDACQLLTISPQGQILSTNLAIGADMLQRQFEQLEGVELETGPATHGVYLPLVNQAKTQLYATCNEFGVALPTHFILLGASSSLPKLTDCFATELGLIPITQDQNFPWETIVAVGVLLQKKSTIRVNFFPSRRKLAWKALLNSVKRIRLKSPKIPQIGSLGFGNAFGPSVWIGAAAIIITLLIAYPLYTRSRAKRWLAAEQRDNANAAYYKALIEKAQAREKELQRRVSLIKVIEQKKYLVSRAMQEIIAIIPNSMKLQSVQFKGDTLTIKGYASSHTQVQEYLKSAQTFKYLTEPVPVGMTEGKEKTDFEILFKMRL